MKLDDYQPVWNGKPFDVSTEEWSKSTWIADTELSRKNKLTLERHLSLEWLEGIDTLDLVMDTFHPDRAFQTIPALGTHFEGHAEVRGYYVGRMTAFPGSALRMPFERVVITDRAIYCEGMFDVKVKEGMEDALQGAHAITSPCIVVIEMRDGLFVGETTYLDSAAVR